MAFHRSSLNLLSTFIMLLCLMLFVLSAGAWWFLDGIWAWSAGLFYLAYDVWLIFFVLFQTRHLATQRHIFPFAKITTQNSIQTLAHSTIINNPTISVLIPARNESLILPKCIEALFAQQDVKAKIYIIDDGSTDHSAHLLEQDYGLVTSQGLIQSTHHENLYILRQASQGKAKALNSALSYIDSDLMVTLDADTVIAPNALQAFITDFQNNPNLVASGGVLQPVCRPNRFSRLFNFFFEFFQQFEYIFSFLSRAAWYKANALLLVSGAFAIYRTEVLKQVGGFDPDSMVEDYELNHRIYRYASEHDLDWTVGITGQAYGVTDAPNGFKAFFHQRQRWFGGFLQTQFAYLDMMANQKYGAVGRLMLPMKMFDAIQPYLGLSAFIILGILIFQADFTQPNPTLYAIFLFILGKMILDLVYHCWGMWIYHRWTEIPLSLKNLPAILFATIFAPFTFQIVKLMGAALGWWVFLTNQKNWRAQREL